MRSTTPATPIADRITSTPFSPWRTWPARPAARRARHPTLGTPGGLEQNPDRGGGAAPEGARSRTPGAATPAATTPAASATAAASAMRPCVRPVGRTCAAATGDDGPLRRNCPGGNRLGWPDGLAAMGGCRLIWLDGDGSDLGRWVTLAAAPGPPIHCRGRPGDPRMPAIRSPLCGTGSQATGRGWLSYEAAAWTEPGNPWAADAMASLWIARHDPLLRFDLQQRKLWIEASDEQKLDVLEQQLNQPQPDPAPPTIGPGELAAPHRPCRLRRWGPRIRDLIAAGDLFQANLTACCSTHWPPEASAVELFIKLRQHCPAPFCRPGDGRQQRRSSALLLPRTVSAGECHGPGADATDQGHAATRWRSDP